MDLVRYEVDAYAKAEDQSKGLMGGAQDMSNGVIINPGFRTQKKSILHDSGAEAVFK